MLAVFLRSLIMINLSRKSRSQYIWSIFPPVLTIHLVTLIQSRDRQCHKCVKYTDQKSIDYAKRILHNQESSDLWNYYFPVCTGWQHCSCCIPQLILVDNGSFILKSNPKENKVRDKIKSSWRFRLEHSSSISANMPTVCRLSKQCSERIAQKTCFETGVVKHSFIFTFTLASYGRYPYVSM